MGQRQHLPVIVDTAKQPNQVLIFQLRRGDARFSERPTTHFKS